MSVIIRLQNLPLTANSLDIRTFFHGLSIPDGGVHIVGGQEGDAFIAFSTDEDARQAMQLNGKQLKESRVSLLLSSRNEMYKVIEQARQAAVGTGSGSGGGGGGPPPYRQQQQHQNSSTAPSSHHHHHHMGGSGSGMSPSGNHSHHHLVSSSSGNHFGHGHGGHQYQSNSNSAVSSSMSPTSSGSNSVANDFLRGMSAKVDNSQNQGSNSGGVSQADLSNNPAILFSTMAAIPSATLGGAQNFLTQQNHNQHNQQHQQQHQSYPGLGQVPSSHSQQQHHQGQSSLGNSSAMQLPFGHPNNTTASPSQNSNPAATVAAAAAAAFANGNPFLIPPPTLPPGLPLNFAGMLPGVGVGAPPPNNNLTANSGLNQTLGLNPQNVMNALGGPGAGSHGHGHNAQANNANPMNPFSNPPPRLGAMTNGGIGVGVSTGPKTGSNHTLSGGHHNHGGPRMNNMNNFGAGGGGPPSMLNPFGAGVGIGTGNMRQNNHNNFNHLNNVGGMGHRNPFGGGMGPRKDGPPQNRFQLGAIPTGRMDLAQGGVGAARRENRSRSRSRERTRGVGPDLLQNRRRRSRSRERDRSRRANRRSRSNSRSRSRDRGGVKPSRRESRDKRELDRKGRSDSSPEKSSQDSSGGRRNRNTEHEPSPTPTPANTTSEEWPGAKLTGIPGDASFREIKDFIRVEVIGGSDGVVRQYDEGVAYLKLANASDYPRVYRSNGRKLRGSAVSIEGITMEVWTQEYKMMKTRNERDIDREKEEEEKREHRRTERTTEREHHGRSERHHHNHNSHSSADPSSTSSSNTSNRSSRFSNASHQSSCIAIRGLAPTITRNELLSRYLLETPCQDFVLIAAPTPTNRHSVTAFVQLETPQVAQNVIDQLARSPLGTGLVVESCEREDLQKAKIKTSGIIPQGPMSGGGVGGRPGMLGGGGIGGVQDAKSIFDLELGLDDETTTVIMKGAPPNITDRDVFDFFSDIGLAPMNVRVLYDTDGQCSGQVICEFQDNNKAKRATTKDGMLFGRGQISVSLLPCRNRIGAGGGGGGGAGAAVFGAGMQDQASFIGRGVRPGLLGVGPRGPSRFSNSPSSSPNIFEQALQQQSTGGGPVRPSLEGNGGTGGAGAGRGARRQSRFSGGNNNTNGGGARNNNGNQNGRQEGTEAEADLGLFAKKGCVIGLENVPYKASMDDILQYLEEILKISISPDRIIRRYDDFNKATGDCRVAFDTPFEAKLACDRLKGTYMWKRLITSAVIE